MPRAMDSGGIAYKVALALTPTHKTYLLYKGAHLCSAG